MKKVCVLFVISIVINLFLSTTVAMSSATRYDQEAGKLNSVSLFLGTNKGYELDREPTRLEALVMLIRLLGKEGEAKATVTSHPFTDVPQWGMPYVAYAYQKSLTNGISSTLFGADQIADETQFLTFVLRALGYDDRQGDFMWSMALNKSIDVGLVDETYLSESKSTFLRDDCIGISYRALFLNLKGRTYTLLEDLINRNIIIQEQALAVFSTEEEGAKEEEAKEEEAKEEEAKEEEAKEEVTEDLQLEKPEALTGYSPVIHELNLMSYVGRSAYEIYDELKVLYGDDVTIWIPQAGNAYVGIGNNGNQEIAFHSYNSEDLIVKNFWIGYNSYGGVTPYGVDVSKRLEHFNRIHVNVGVNELLSELAITKEDFTTERMIDNKFRVLGYSWEAHGGLYRLEVIDDFSAIFGLGFYDGIVLPASQ